MTIEDHTSHARLALADYFRDYLASIRALISLFDRELISAAVAELSERLVAQVADATRVKRGSRGFDLIDQSQQCIEVKARISSTYGRKTQFNFRRGSEHAHKAYCLCWHFDSEGISLDRVFVAPMTGIRALNGRKYEKYYARTTLGELETALQAVRP